MGPLADGIRREWSAHGNAEAQRDIGVLNRNNYQDDANETPSPYLPNQRMTYQIWQAEGEDAKEQ
jgi:hypothetical protein